MIKSLVDWEPYRPFTVGFDSLWDRLNTLELDVPNYPPYNIRKIDDLKYAIDIALAGFGKKDIKVNYSDNSLTIKSVKDESKKDDIVHRGISHRSFTRTFALSDDVIVNDAKFENGLLSIELEKIVPEEKRPKEIKIS
jgi:molecular chaperone IbpA